ncbi:putative ubiquitin carboxyl-terminal hydrolase MINDY-4 isoform 1-T1 [Odontesthes bonariensis]|uniref:putative ubiquitin carboxyl-terminal hydrolase MINDY-4 isoform X1 n=2 Tax=Odontesthes bonariensis TaxID=219752 RepID=UPI003F5845CF
MAASVEEVSSSLVREYLSRKGLKKTIACMDEEHPRTEASINNRSQLRQMLNIEDLYRKNKVQNSPVKTLLEIIVKHHIEQLKNDKLPRSDSDSLQSVQTISSSANCYAGEPSVMNDAKADEITPAFLGSKHTKSRPETKETCPPQPTCTSLLSERDGLFTHRQTDVPAHDSDYKKGQTQMVFRQENENFVQRESDKSTTLTTESTLRSRTSRIRRGMMAGPIPQDSNRKKQGRRAEVSQPLFRKEEENKQFRDGLLLAGIHQKSLEGSLKSNSSASCVGWNQGLLSTSGRIQSQSSDGKTGQQHILKTRKLKTRPTVCDPNVSEMVLDDIDDDDLQESSKVSLQRTVATRQYAGCPMDQHTATELKAVLLGSSLNRFSVEWRNQGFTFSDDLRYGIVQRKGGPCGVLASIQAFVLKKLLFENTESIDCGLQRLRPSNSTRRQCLISAMAEVLWRAGVEKRATVVINSGNNHFTPSGHFRSEGVLEKIMCFTVDDVKDLQLILEQHVEQFETGMLGCVLLIISAVLSRSIEKVKEDMDVPTTTLIGAHGYCTQELVNLLLCGRAASNVFDNDMELDSGNGNMTLLKGIKGHCDVGLLSLFEHYNICKVGAFLKTPSYPIWVVCSESHFSVLFGLQRELLTNEEKVTEFDLYYYDGLANQQEEIHLTVSVGKLTQSFQEVDTDLIPPLELCIRTRWKDAFVSWNDTEPIL